LTHQLVYLLAAPLLSDALMTALATLLRAFTSTSTSTELSSWLTNASTAYARSCTGCQVQMVLGLQACSFNVGPLAAG
jgi:hypothetical protein